MKKSQRVERPGLIERFSQLLDRLSEYLSQRKGLLPIVGVILVLANFGLQFLPFGWVSQSNLLLHLGVVIAIIGFLLAWAL